MRTRGTKREDCRSSPPLSSPSPHHAVAQREPTGQRPDPDASRAEQSDHRCPSSAAAGERAARADAPAARPGRKPSEARTTPSPVAHCTLAIVVARRAVAIIVARRAVAPDVQREPISLRPDPKASQAKRAPLPLLCQRRQRARSKTRPASCPTSTQAKQSEDGFVARRPSSVVVVVIIVVVIVAPRSRRPPARRQSDPNEQSPSCPAVPFSIITRAASLHP